MDLNPVGFDVISPAGVDDSLSCDTITGSDAQGVARSELCYNVIDCILQTNCIANNSVQPCYCGSAGTACTTAGAANGACLAAEQAGLENADPTFAATNFTNTDLATGRANLLGQCMIYAGCSSCLN